MYQSELGDGIVRNVVPVVGSLEEILCTKVRLARGLLSRVK